VGDRVGGFGIGGIEGGKVGFVPENDGGAGNAGIRGAGDGSRGLAFGEEYGGAVGHLEDVGHVGAGRDIEDGMAQAGGFENVEHRGAEHAGVDGGGLAGFEPDIDVEVLPGETDEIDELFAVVFRFGDPMAAAHVEVADARGAQQVAEFGIDGGEGRFEIPGVLFAEGVEMDAGDAVEFGLREAGELVGCGSEPGTGRAGVVERREGGRMFRVDAQPETQLAGAVARVGGGETPETQPLFRGVEIDLGGEFAEFGDFEPGVGGRVGEDFLFWAAEMVSGEPGLPKARGAAPVEVGGERRKCLPAGEALQSEGDAAVCGVGHLAQNAGVAFKCGK